MRTEAAHSRPSRSETGAEKLRERTICFLPGGVSSSSMQQRPWSSSQVRSSTTPPRRLTTPPGTLTKSSTVRTPRASSLAAVLPPTPQTSETGVTAKAFSLRAGERSSQLRTPPEDGMNLGPVVAELGERLRGRNARTGRNPRPLEHASPRLAAERRKILHARDVRKLLVDRIDLLPRHERADHRHHAVRHRLIELVVAREHRDAVPLGELPDLKVRDTPRNAERLRLGRPRHDAAVVVREDHHGRRLSVGSNTLCTEA